MSKYSDQLEATYKDIKALQKATEHSIKGDTELEDYFKRKGLKEKDND